MSENLIYYSREQGKDAREYKTVQDTVQIQLWTKSRTFRYAFSCQ